MKKHTNVFNYWLILPLIFLIVAKPGFSQPATKDPQSVSPNNIFISNASLFLSGAVLLFGTIVVVLEFQLIRIKRITSIGTPKILLVTLIITGALFLISAGYAQDQISPGLGLLGTIAGYLLGRNDGEQHLNNETTDPNVNATSPHNSNL